MRIMTDSRHVRRSAAAREYLVSVNSERTRGWRRREKEYGGGGGGDGNAAANRRLTRLKTAPRCTKREEREEGSTSGSTSLGRKTRRSRAEDVTEKILSGTRSRG